MIFQALLPKRSDCQTCGKQFTPPARWNRIAMPKQCLSCWAEKAQRSGA